MNPLMDLDFADENMVTHNLKSHVDAVLEEEKESSAFDSKINRSQ